jgi:hypothetical protein
MSFSLRSPSRYTNAPLTEDELFRRAPSIFATEAHESRSQRFRPIPTIDVLRALSKEGFHAVGAKQSRSRDESKRDFTKHMIRLRRFDDVSRTKSSDSVCEIILKNANDGTSAYDLLSGMFREICLNGLIACTDKIDTVKVRHSGNAIENVIEGTYTVLSQTERVLAAPDVWSGIQLSRDAAKALAAESHMIRFEGAETPITHEQLLIPRRREDTKTDLWTVFNVIQENTIKGGLSAMRATQDVRGRTQLRRVTTRPVNGIDQDVKLNRALWSLSERMASILSSQHLAVA